MYIETTLDLTQPNQPVKLLFYDQMKDRMGIIERRKTTTAFLLQGLLIYQLYSTGSNLSQWPPLALSMLQIEYVTDLITSLEDHVDVLFSVCRTHAKSYSTRDKWGGGVCNDNYHDGSWTISGYKGWSNYRLFVV